MTCFAAEGAKEEVKPPVKSDDTFQAFSVLTVTLIIMAEDEGVRAEMSLRQFHCLMHYGEPIIRKFVTLSISLISVLSSTRCQNTAAQTTTSLLRSTLFLPWLCRCVNQQCVSGKDVTAACGHYYKEPGYLFMVRIAQGLVHMGKGMIVLDPFFADRSIMSLPVVAGLLVMLMALTDVKHFVLDEYRWMMYFLVTAMYPRFLITVDEQLNSMPVTVCIRQALDTVAPGATERVELVPKEFIPFGHVLLEGFYLRLGAGVGGGGMVKGNGGGGGGSRASRGRGGVKGGRGYRKEPEIKAEPRF
ncbi:hypothetical protein DFH08DRAFT_966999 [Mycena albidolilacea]|uniref:Uncharacterized protein n=1 Tax=Mycena albidolilacea TaxID=1033008 RepID=A0AAD6ZN26_9AGAR|nr:hypothetical protein DFH08DRAFT_966999 [Mycena albidolilacea]